MNTKDITEKHLEEYDDVFADIINVLLFNGNQLVKESDLENSLTKSQYKADLSEIHEQERDVAKYWKNGLIKIAIYGLENQTQIDKDMPLRIIGYDGQSYRSQLLKDEDGKKSNNRYPVLTLILYFGMKRWNEYRSLYDVLNIPEELKPFVSDYKINVFEIAYLNPEQVNMFTSDFKYVADYFVQMRLNKDYVPSKEAMTHVDAVLKIMSVLTNDNRFIDAQNSIKGGISTMCELLDRIEQRGREEGREEGREKERFSSIERMLKKGKSPEQISDFCGYDLDEVLSVQKELLQTV